MLGACQADAPPPAPKHEHSTEHDAPQPKAAEQGTTYGQGLTLAGPPVDVVQVLEAPETYLGKKLQCEGTVARVCQAAGCWLELRGRSDAEGLRVPMAGHAFFVPQSLVGKRAVIEGELSAMGLSPEARAHLTGEGLKATGPLSLSATGLVVR